MGMVKRLKETTNRSLNTSDTVILKAKNPSSPSKSYSRRRLLNKLKIFAMKTEDSNLKFDLLEVLKFLRGEEMEETKELKKIAEDAFNENEALIEKNSELLAERDFKAGKFSKSL